MDRNIESDATNLVNVYAKYFIEDYALNVLSFVKASVPCDANLVGQTVRSEIETRYGASIVNPAQSVNCVTKFLYECAVFAIERNVENATSREAYDLIKALPSAHHDEINQCAYAAAQSYLTTLDFTLITTIGSDVGLITQGISSEVQNRLSCEDTGARVHRFNWGILNNGMWLNGALMKAFDRARIFRPGEEPVAYYAVAAVDFARTVRFAPIAPEANSQANASFGVLLSNMDVAVPGADAIQTVLFGTGGLENAIDMWERGLKNTTYLVEVVSQLSDMAESIPLLTDKARSLLDDDLVDSVIVERLAGLNDVVTLMLVAFEALRETTYSKSLILNCEAFSADPVVDVVVNADLINGFLSAGGCEEDLGKIGTFLDPRKGTLKPAVGWNIDSMLSGRENMVAHVISQNAERVEAMRNNDVNVISQIVNEKLTPVVTTYAQAAETMHLWDQLEKQIYVLGRRLSDTEAQAGFDLEDEIGKILVSAVNDPLLTKVAGIFCSFTTSTENAVRENARALTVAAVAVSEIASAFEAPQVSVTNIDE